MAPRESSSLLQVQAFRRQQRWWNRLCWVLGGGLVIASLCWFLVKSLAETMPPATSVSAASKAGPPWQLGNPDGRFILTLYADLECPFCRAYFPALTHWMGQNNEVALQWQHLPLAAHEPAASAEARLAECVGQIRGNAAFWQAVEWIYTHTRGDGQGLPDGLHYPGLTPAIEQCLASEQPNGVIRSQVERASKNNVTATPSLRLQDRHTGKVILLEGPIEGDALLSAMDMLAAYDSAAIHTKEMPADVVGDMPR